MTFFKVCKSLLSSGNWSRNLRKTISTFNRVSTGIRSPVTKNTLSIQKSLPFSRVCACCLHQISQGDQQLLAFLTKELDYERETVSNLEQPTLEEFKNTVEVKDTNFKITILRNGERVVVSFDVDQSINHEVFDDQHEPDGGKIASYPSFSIQIIKDSGATLQFNCEYNVDDGTESTEEESDNDLFMISDVCILPHPDADHSNIYHCETENMDYGMYEMLIGMLIERGIDNRFLEDLLRKSTILEHEHYLQFLQGLQDFLLQGK